MNINTFISRFFGRDEAESSKNMAKERLRLVLVHDRLDISEQVMNDLRVDLINMIGKYFSIDEKTLEVSLSREAEGMALVANIPIRRQKYSAPAEKADKSAAAKADKTAAADKPANAKENKAAATDKTAAADKTTAAEKKAAAADKTAVADKTAAEDKAAATDKTATAPAAKTKPPSQPKPEPAKPKQGKSKGKTGQPPKN